MDSVEIDLQIESFRLEIMISNHKGHTTYRRRISNLISFNIFSSKVSFFQEIWTLRLRTIHLRRRQIFIIFDPYPLPSAIFYY